MRKILKNISLWILVVTLAGFSGNWVLGMKTAKKQQTGNQAEALMRLMTTISQDNQTKLDSYIASLKDRSNELTKNLTGTKKLLSLFYNYSGIVGLIDILTSNSDGSFMRYAEDLSTLSASEEATKFSKKFLIKGNANDTYNYLATIVNIMKYFKIEIDFNLNSNDLQDMYYFIVKKNENRNFSEILEYINQDKDLKNKDIKTKITEKYFKFLQSCVLGIQNKKQELADLFKQEIDELEDQIQPGKSGGVIPEDQEAIEAKKAELDKLQGAFQDVEKQVSQKYYELQQVESQLRGKQVEEQEARDKLGLEQIRLNDVKSQLAWEKNELGNVTYRLVASRNELEGLNGKIQKLQINISDFYKEEDIIKKELEKKKAKLSTVNVVKDANTKTTHLELSEDLKTIKTGMRKRHSDTNLSIRTLQSEIAIQTDKVIPTDKETPTVTMAVDIQTETMAEVEIPKDSSIPLQCSRTIYFDSSLYQRQDFNQQSRAQNINEQLQKVQELQKDYLELKQLIGFYSAKAYGAFWDMNEQISGFFSEQRDLNFTFLVEHNPDTNNNTITINNTINELEQFNNLGICVHTLCENLSTKKFLPYYYETEHTENWTKEQILAVEIDEINWNLFVSVVLPSRSEEGLTKIEKEALLVEMQQSTIELPRLYANLIDDIKKRQEEMKTELEKHFLDVSKLVNDYQALIRENFDLKSELEKMKAVMLEIKLEKQKIMSPLAQKDEDFFQKQIKNPIDQIIKLEVDLFVNNQYGEVPVKDSDNDSNMFSFFNLMKIDETDKQKILDIKNKLLKAQKFLSNIFFFPLKSTTVQQYYKQVEDQLTKIQKIFEEIQNFSQNLSEKTEYYKIRFFIKDENGNNDSSVEYDLDSLNILKIIAEIKNCALDFFIYEKAASIRRSKTIVELLHKNESLDYLVQPELTEQGENIVNHENLKLINKIKIIHPRIFQAICNANLSVLSILSKENSNLWETLFGFSSQDQDIEEAEKPVLGGEAEVQLEGPYHNLRPFLERSEELIMAFLQAKEEQIKGMGVFLNENIFKILALNSKLMNYFLNAPESIKLALVTQTQTVKVDNNGSESMQQTYVPTILQAMSDKSNLISALEVCQDAATITALITGKDGTLITDIIEAFPPEVTVENIKEFLQSGVDKIKFLICGHNQQLSADVVGPLLKLPRKYLNRFLRFDEGTIKSWVTTKEGVLNPQLITFLADENNKHFWKLFEDSTEENIALLKILIMNKNEIDMTILKALSQQGGNPLINTLISINANEKTQDKIQEKIQLLVQSKVKQGEEGEEEGEEEGAVKVKMDDSVIRQLIELEKVEPGCFAQLLSKDFEKIQLLVQSKGIMNDSVIKQFIELENAERGCFALLLSKDNETIQLLVQSKVKQGEEGEEEGAVEVKMDDSILKQLVALAKVNEGQNPVQKLLKRSTRKIQLLVQSEGKMDASVLKQLIELEMYGTKTEQDLFQQFLNLSSNTIMQLNKANIIKSFIELEKNSLGFVTTFLSCEPRIIEGFFSTTENGLRILTELQRVDPRFQLLNKYNENKLKALLVKLDISQYTTEILTALKSQEQFTALLELEAPSIEALVRNQDGQLNPAVISSLADVGGDKFKELMVALKDNGRPATIKALVQFDKTFTGNVIAACAKADRSQLDALLNLRPDIIPAITFNGTMINTQVIELISVWSKEQIAALANVKLENLQAVSFKEDAINLKTWILIAKFKDCFSGYFNDLNNFFANILNAKIAEMVPEEINSNDKRDNFFRILSVLNEQQLAGLLLNETTINGNQVNSFNFLSSVSEENLRIMVGFEKQQLEKMDAKIFKNCFSGAFAKAISDVDINKLRQIDDIQEISEGFVGTVIALPASLIKKTGDAKELDLQKIKQRIIAEQILETGEKTNGKAMYLDPEIKGVFLKEGVTLAEFIKQAKQVGITIEEIISNEATSNGFKKLENAVLYYKKSEGQVYVFGSVPNIEELKIRGLMNEELYQKVKAPQATLNKVLELSSFVEFSEKHSKMVIDSNVTPEVVLSIASEESQIATQLKLKPELIKFEDDQTLKQLNEGKVYTAGKNQVVVSGDIEDLQLRITAQEYDMKNESTKFLSLEAEEGQTSVHIILPEDQKIAIIRQNIAADELKKALRAANIEIPEGDGKPSAVVSEVSQSSKMVIGKNYLNKLDGIFISSNDGLTELKAISDLGFEGTKLGKEIEKKDKDLAQAQLEKQQAEQSNQIAQNEKNAADAKKDAAESAKNTAEQKLQVAESEKTKLTADLQNEQKERLNGNAKIVELEEQIKALKLKSVKPEFTVEDLVTKMKDPKFKSALESKLKTDKNFKSNMTKSTGSSYFVPAVLGSASTAPVVIFGTNAYHNRKAKQQSVSVIDEIRSKDNYQQEDNQQQDNNQQDNGNLGSQSEQSNQDFYEISAQ